MSTSSPTINPRLRLRESDNPTTVTAPSPAAVAHSKLRVLIRLPHVAAESKSPGRFQLAVALLAGLKRRYAAAAFIVFLVAMVAILLHGKSGETARSDHEPDTRWNGAVTVPAVQQPPTGRQGPSSAALHSGDRQPPPAAPMAQSAVRQGPTDAQGRPALPPIVTASADPIPNMPRNSPPRDGFADPTPPWRGQPSAPPGDPSRQIIR